MGGPRPGVRLISARERHAHEPAPVPRIAWAAACYCLGTRPATPGYGVPSHGSAKNATCDGGKAIGGGCPTVADAPRSQMLC
jgi:hypothetical protein